MGLDLSGSMLFDCPSMEKLRDFLLTDVMAVKGVDTATAADARFASDGASAKLPEEIETLIASG